MTPAGLLGTLSDWYERNQDKLVGSGIRGAATRGLLGLEPPKDATKAEMEAYRNFANASMALAAGPVAATRAIKGAKTLKDAPRAEAMETARQNAVKMLGLPESNTAMDRAKAMGFGDDWYHGTQNAKDGIDAFKPSIGYAGQAPTSAVWMAQHPYVADDFATWIHGAGNPTVYPVKVRSGNVANIADLEEAAIAARVDPDPQMSLYSAKVQSSLKSKGFDSARFDSGDGDYKVVFDPSRIRSRFAAFDPARIDEKDLLASLAAMGITLPLTMGLLSDQTD